MPSRRTLAILACHALALLAWIWLAPGWVAAMGPRRGAEAIVPAIAGAIAIHAALTQAILRWGRGGGIAGAIASGILIVAGLAFLVAAVVIGDIQDYHLYLDIWREILAGRDPWYLVVGGPDGSFSLNAYGPLYNALAIPTLWNPLGPKLLFAGSYWAFVAWLSLAAPRRGLPGWSAPALAVWFAGPFAWVEIAGFGHFDVLVALACVAAVGARSDDRRTASALWTSAGILLKYFPGVLAPFLALDRGRVRWRWLAGVAAMAAAGLGIAWWVWGSSAFRPLALAARRESAGLSIFRFLRGRYSPIDGEALVFTTDEYAGPILLLGLFGAWRWARRTRLDAATAGVLGVAVTLALYKVGFPQYFMVPYLLAPAWFVAGHAALTNRGRLVAAYLAAFAWVSWYDANLARGRQDAADQWAGLVTFPLMLALSAAIASAGRREEPAEEVRPLESDAEPRRA